MDIYDEYRRRLLAMNFPESEVDLVVQGMRSEDEKVQQGLCPACNAPLTMVRDPRQDGWSELAGVWINYRCTERCGWAQDRKEPVGEN